MTVKSKKKKLSAERKLEKDLIKIFAFVVVLALLYWVASSYFKSLNHFEYEGLSFTKERFGELTVYHYYYYITNEKGQPIQYNVYLRYDPRENNITAEGDLISFEKRYIYMTFDSSYPGWCKESGSSVVDLSLFFSQNQMKVFTGLMNESAALEANRTYITCDNQVSSAEVIEFKGGNETKIVVDGNCHQIIIGPECRTREATEKFKINALIEARKRASGL